MKRFVKLMSLMSIVFVLAFTACEEGDLLPCTVLPTTLEDSYTSCNECTAEASDELRVGIRVDGEKHLFKTSSRSSSYSSTPEHATIAVNDFSSVSVAVVATSDGMERAFVEYQCEISGVDRSGDYDKSLQAPSGSICQLSFRYDDNFELLESAGCSSVVIHALAYDEQQQPMRIKIRLVRL